MIKLTDFLSLNWKERQKELDALTVKSCKIQGRTYREAEQKRKPIEEHRQRLQEAHDAEIKVWVKQY